MPGSATPPSPAPNDHIGDVNKMVGAPPLMRN